MAQMYTTILETMPRVQVYVHNYRGTHQDKEEEVEKILMHKQLIC